MSVKAVHWALNEVRGVKPSTKLVLAKLADHSNDDGVSWPGKKAMAEQLDISKRTVDSAVEELQSIGLITVTKRPVQGGKNETNIYQLHMDKTHARQGASSAPYKDGIGCNSRKDRVQNLQGQGASSAPESSIESSIEPSVSSASGDAGHGYRSKKGKTLSGEVLNRFNKFWDAFDYKNGKAEAADAWLQVEKSLKRNIQLFTEILKAARATATARSDLPPGSTPKMAAGWLDGRRWEDHQEAAGAVNGTAKPWFTDYNQVLVKAVDHGVETHSGSKPVDVIGGLIEKLEAAGEEVPKPLVAWHTKLSGGASA